MIRLASPMMKRKPIRKVSTISPEENDRVSGSRVCRQAGRQGRGVGGEGAETFERPGRF